jgi:hypothetical protein
MDTETPVLAPPAPEYEFDFNKMATTNKVLTLHQEGNWLVGVSEHGIKFRQHIPQGKRLNKIGDNYILEDATIR